MYWQISGTGGRAPPPWTSRRAPPDRAPRPRPADLLLQLPGAPGLLGGGAGPVAGDRPEPPGGSRPRRVSGPAPSSSPTRLKHPLDRSGSARAPRRQPDRTSSELIGVLPGCGHGSSSFHGFRPSTTPGAIQSRSRRIWALSTRRRGWSRDGKNDPVRSLGMASSTSPAVVATVLRRLPLRLLVRCGVRDVAPRADHGGGPGVDQARAARPGSRRRKTSS